MLATKPEMAVKNCDSVFRQHDAIFDENIKEEKISLFWELSKTVRRWQTNTKNWLCFYIAIIAASIRICFHD